MKKVYRYQTSDGALHETFHLAECHADQRYGALLTKTASTLAQIDKYSAMSDWLDANLPVFVELIALKADISLDNSDDGNGD